MNSTEPTIPTNGGYRESTITVSEQEAEYISDALQMQANNYSGVNVAAVIGLTWVMDTLEPQWEGRGMWPRDFTLLDIQWEVVEEALEAQEIDKFIEHQYPDGGWYHV